jgi:hypothetical protein
MLQPVPARELKLNANLLQNPEYGSHFSAGGLQQKGNLPAMFVKNLFLECAQRIGCTNFLG